MHEGTQEAGQGAGHIIGIGGGNAGGTEGRFTMIGFV